MEVTCPLFIIKNNYMNQKISAASELQLNLPTMSTFGQNLERCGCYGELLITLHVF